MIWNERRDRERVCTGTRIKIVRIKRCQFEEFPQLGLFVAVIVYQTRRTTLEQAKQWFSFLAIFHRLSMIEVRMNLEQC